MFSPTHGLAYELLLSPRYTPEALTKNILHSLYDLLTQRYWVMFALEEHCTRALSVMATEGDTWFLDTMPVFTKHKMKSEFTGRQGCRLITSLLLALHSYSSCAVVPPESTAVFAAARDFKCWESLCMLTANLHVSKPVLLSGFCSAVWLDSLPKDFQ